MGVDIEQIGYLLVAHPFQHRHTEHTLVAVGQLVDERQNLFVSLCRPHINRHSCLLDTVKRHLMLLLALLQIGQRQVLCHLLHPGLSLGYIFNGIDLAENQKECVVKQVFACGLVRHIALADTEQPVVHQCVQLSECLAVAPLALLHNLSNASCFHHSLFNHHLTSVDDIQSWLQAFSRESAVDVFCRSHPLAAERVDGLRKVRNDIDGSH